MCPDNATPQNSDVLQPAGTLARFLRQSASMSSTFARFTGSSLLLHARCTESGSAGQRRCASVQPSAAQAAKMPSSTAGTACVCWWLSMRSAPLNWGNAPKKRFNCAWTSHCTWRRSSAFSAPSDSFSSPTKSLQKVPRSPTSSGTSDTSESGAPSTRFTCSAMESAPALTKGAAAAAAASKAGLLAKMLTDESTPCPPHDEQSSRMSRACHCVMP